MKIIKPDMIDQPAIIHRPQRRVLSRVGMGISAKLQCSVVRNGKVIREYPWQHNLILNRFMERIYGFTIEGNFRYAAASTSSTPTSVDSGVTTASQTTTTVTLVGGAFLFTPGTGAGTDSVDVGKIIKWDTGEYARITAVPAAGAGAQATVTPSQSVSAGEFTVYQTTQTSMGSTGNEERAGAGIAGTGYLTGAGNCDFVEDGSGNVVMTRTYDFAIRANNDRVGTPYAEVGWTDSNVVGGATINSRVVLASPVSVAQTEQLRVKYQVTVTFSPIVSTASPQINGWPANSAGVYQLLFPALRKINQADGASIAYIGTVSPMEPSENTKCFLSVDSTAFNAYRVTPPNRSGFTNFNVATTKSTPGPSFLNFTDYPQPNTLFHDKVAFFSAAVGNSTLWRSHHWGDSLGNTIAQDLSCIMNAVQTKDSLHSLQLNLRFTYTRIIV